MNNVEPIYQELAGKVTKEKNKTLPKVLKMIASPEQAEIMRDLPAKVEEIAEKLSRDEESISKDLQYLYERGLVSPGKKGWYLVGHIVFLKDRVASANHKYDDDELFELLQEMSLSAIFIKEFPELEGERSYTDVEGCIGRALCVASCSTDARTMKLVRPLEHIPDPASMFDNESYRRMI